MEEKIKVPEELINRTLDTIQAKWDKKSEELEEEGEGTVDFDVLLDIVKEALEFIYLQGQSDTKKEIEYRLKENNMQHNFECGVKIGVEQGQSDFKENLLMTKTNHQLGCMLECYEEVISNRIGFEKEAKQLGEIASKLK